MQDAKGKQMLDQQLTKPSWAEFAWSAFLYKMIAAGDVDYQQLIGDSVFCNALRTNRSSLQPSDVREKLVKNFLNRWKTRVKNSDDKPAKALAKQIEISRDDLNILSQFSIRNVNLGTGDDPSSPATHAIENCYVSVRKSGYHIGATATAKILHILHPDLFVMWDNPILSCFMEQYPGKVKDSGRGYCEYLRLMQQVAGQVTQDFKKAELYPAPLPGAMPEDYLSTQLQYRHAKTMAKYLDEYYWVLVTHGKKNLKMPPEWHPEKRQPSL